MSRIILCDVDDVLFKTIQACSSRLKRETGYDMPFENFGPDWAATMDPEAYQYLDRVIFRDPSLYDDIEVIPGALEGIEGIRSMGDQVFLVTAGPPEAFGGKAAALRRLGFLDPDDLFCSDLMGVTRKDLIRGDVIIDDSLHNLIETRVPHRIMFDRPWNQGVELAPTIARAATWRGVAAHIKTISRGTPHQHAPTAGRALVR